MSSVTAVPLQPLPKGTVLKLWLGIVFVILLAVGLAWLGTGNFQYNQVANGARYRTIEAGTGPKVTPNDLVQLHFQATRVADGTILISTARTGQPEEVTVNGFFPGLRDVMLEVQKGGAYEVLLTAQQATGEVPTPGQGLEAGDLVKFELRVVNVAPGMGAMRGMMGPGGAGPGGPGGSMPPGAMPPGAMPPGAMPPGAMPPGAMPPGAIPPGAVPVGPGKQ